jgi:hypothetical protein
MKTKYRTVDITTLKGLLLAERYYSRGWTIISSTPFTVIFEKFEVNL